MTHRHHRSRSAFTLVEMLVSTALIIFVMVILTQVFGYGLQSIRQMRGSGSLQEQLRYATNMLRSDLSAQHFGRENGPWSGPYLSQQRLDKPEWKPPKEGFFRILQGGKPVSEGSDGDGIAAFRATNHALHFTVRMDLTTGQGSGRERFFKTKNIPGAWMSGLMPFLYPSDLEYLSQDQDYSSRWAEVAYFLDKSGQQANGNDLFTLYRRRRIALDSNVVAAMDDQNPLYAGSAIAPGPSGEMRTDVSTFAHPRLTIPNSSDFRCFFNTPANLTNPLRRFGLSTDLYRGGAVLQALLVQAAPASQVAAMIGAPKPATPLHHALANTMPIGTQQYKPIFKTTTLNSAYQSAMQNDNGGDDILLENVLSMEIRVNWDVPNTIADPSLANYFVNSPRSEVQLDGPFDTLPPSLTNSVFNGVDGPLCFDTWCRTDNYQWLTGTPNAPNVPNVMNIPLRIRVKAIQIRLRVWDIKTQQARQVTIVQDM